MARNVIERTFGSLKRRFGLMIASPEYSEEKQAKFVPALCVLHNFISVYDCDIIDTSNTQLLPSRVGIPHQPSSMEPERPEWVSEEEEVSASTWRNRIADEMWVNYQEYLSQMDIG